MTRHPAKIKICSLHELLILISEKTSSLAGNIKNDITNGNEKISRKKSHEQQDVLYGLQGITEKKIIAKEFVVTIPENNKELEIFIVARQHSAGLQLFCYQNQCPHTLINLNWQPDQFLSLDQSRIQCSMHGALFRIDDGFCEWGPCQGRVLQSIQTSIENDTVFILL